MKICIFVKTQLDIERDVKNKRNISVQTHFYTKSKDEMGYHVAKKHAEQSSKQTTVCPFCEQEFPTYYSLQQYRRKELGAKQKKPSDTVADLNKIVEEEGEDGGKLKEELSACQHFLSFALKSHLLCSKADLITIQGKVEKFGIVEQCAQERQNTKWRFKLIRNVTIFAALLKNILMGCLTRTFTTTYAGELSFILQRQGTLQRSFVSFHCIGNVHERTQGSQLPHFQILYRFYIKIWL